jgi:excisionase family DNA binding protein
MDSPSKSSTGPTGGREPFKTISLAEAAALCRLSPSTLRRYVKAGKLKASRVRGRYGEEYRIRPAVLKVFALEVLGLTLAAEDMEGLEGVDYTHPEQPYPGLVELYERLLEATAEATRYKALCEVSEGTHREAEEDYKAQLAALMAERAALADEKAALQERLEALEHRGFWARLFGRWPA